VRSHVFLLKRTLFVILTEKLFLLRRGISLSFRQRSCFCFDEESPCHSDREVFYFDEESTCHSDREAVFASTRNLFVIPTEKRFFSHKKLLQNDSSLLSFRQRSCFCFDEESFCHSDREAVFALTRNLVVIPTEKFFCFDEESHCHSDREKILQSLKSSFRMTVAYCHSDREVFYFDEESRCRSDTQRFFSHAKLFQNDSGLLSFRQRSFLLRRGISLSLRHAKILQSQKAPSE
jgi:hypothetical protein